MSSFDELRFRHACQAIIARYIGQSVGYIQTESGIQRNIVVTKDNVDMLSGVEVRNIYSITEEHILELSREINLRGNIYIDRLSIATIPMIVHLYSVPHMFDPMWCHQCAIIYYTGYVEVLAPKKPRQFRQDTRIKNLIDASSFFVQRGYAIYIPTSLSYNTPIEKGIFKIIQ